MSVNTDQKLAAVLELSLPATTKGRNLQMPGDARYQPDPLKPYLGYDNWASWLIIVEWFWMVTLAKIGVMPENHARLLTTERLLRLIRRITTKIQDDREYGRDGSHDGKGTKHDIIALLELMRQYLPKTLHRYLHMGATSYDIISTAYALQIHYTVNQAFCPMLCDVDKVWRYQIGQNAEVVQAGRTHLQTALPITVGFWLAGLHNRFVSSARRVIDLSLEVPGKFTGAVGTSSAQRVLFKSRKGEKVLMELLGLPPAEISTQIAPPEGMARFYFELVLLSGALANLGEDVRILQSSQFSEIISASSTSSAMPHKMGNPIAAEQVAGMHTTVQAEFTKVMMNLVSDLGRDLRNSSPMRSYSAVMVYVFQQLKTTLRLLKSMKVDQNRCWENFGVHGKLVVAELLHLALMNQGYPETHAVLNENVVPAAMKSGNSLAIELDRFASESDNDELMKAWQKVPAKIKAILSSPDTYLGDAVKIADNEYRNELVVRA